MTNTMFEKLLALIDDFSKGQNISLQSTINRQACANKFVAQHPNVSADAVHAFLTFPEEQIDQDWLYNYPARIGVHVLRAITPSDEGILQIALRVGVPWYIKQEVMHALALPLARFDWNGLENILANKELENEVRTAALDTVVAHNRAELLPFLKSLGSESNSSDYFAKEFERKVQMARISLGDMTLIVPTLRLKLSQQWNKQRDAEEALKLLDEAVGGRFYIAQSLLAEMGKEPSVGHNPEIWLRLQSHPDPAVCIWAISQAVVSEEQHERCRAFLASPHWLVRRTAADWLIAKETDPELVLRIASNDELDLVTRSWAAYVSMALGTPAEKIEALDQDAESIRFVPWPFSIPSVMRKAIVLEYVDEMADESDIRYRVEALCDQSPAYSESDADADRARLLDALKQNGFNVVACQTAGDFNRQGGGNFWVISIQAGDNILWINLSTLGPFASGPDWENLEIEVNAELRIAIGEIKKLLAEVHISYIDDDLLSRTVPGLNVYYFGSRGPLSIRELLFYWQD